MQTIAQGWLVLKLSNNALDLGLMGLVRALPLIAFSLIGGASADFVDRRKLLYITQTVLATTALTLGILTWLGYVQVWHIYILSFINGIAQAFDQPTRQSLVPRLVPREDLLNALALNSMAFQGAALFGPTATALLVPYIGLQGAFFANALSFGSVIIALTFMELPAGAAAQRTHSVWEDLIAGIRYAAANKSIMALLLIGAITSVFGRGYNAFLPVFADRVLHVGIQGLSVLSTSVGAGTIVFAMGVASLGPGFRHKGKLVVVAALTFAVFLSVYAWSPYFYLTLLALFLVGGLNVAMMSTINTTVQTLTRDEVRGRVMSLFTIVNMAGMPLGQAPLGWFIDRVGPSVAVSTGATIVFSGVLAVVLWIRQLWVTQ